MMIVYHKKQIVVSNTIVVVGKHKMRTPYLCLVDKTRYV